MTAPPKWAYRQADLFNANVAEQALVEAIQRVERNASEEWLLEASKAIQVLATHREQFTTDGVWAILARWNVESPHEERAMGAAMRRAQKNGWCIPTDQVSRSVRPACHRRPLRVWRSLIYVVNQPDTEQIDTDEQSS